MMVTAGGEGVPAPILVPLDLRPGDGAEDERRARLRRWSIVAAALLHLAVLAWLLVDWRRAPAPEPVHAIAVTLVRPPAPPPAAVAPKPPAPPQPMMRRQSGKDERTTAPPAAEKTGPETAPPPAAEPAQKPPAPALPALKGFMAPPAGARTGEPWRAEPRKPAPRATAPHRALPRADVALGERQETGDPYLNHMRDMIERHRFYPAAAGPLGLQGVAFYRVLIDHAGRIVGITVLRSSGASILDDAGIRMIRDAAPFPPLPAGYPSTGVLITIRLPIVSAPGEPTAPR